MKKTLLLLLTFYSAMAISQKREEGLLLAFSSQNNTYTTLFLTFKNKRVELRQSCPFIIIPEKSQDWRTTGKLMFMQKDTLNCAYYEELYGLTLFTNLSSVLNFKDTFFYDFKKPTEEEIKIDLEKERVKNSWNNETYNDELAMALSQTNIYDNSGLEVIYIFYPFVTLGHWNSTSGGAHPNWGERIITDEINDSLFKDKMPYTIQPKKYYVDNERTFGCCNLNDSLFTLLNQQAIKGIFIDTFDDSMSDSTYGISNASDAYSIIDRVNGEPHCLLRADVPASYATSGDYSLTVEIDMGVIDQRLKKSSKYEISSDNGEYGITFQDHFLRVYDRSDKLIYELKLENSFTKIILEEWSYGLALTEWKKILKSKK
jgi:hypothetical protein